MLYLRKSGYGQIGWLVKDPGQRSRELMTMPYTDYLQTPEWNVTRKAALNAADYRCQVCNASDTELHVHHRTYERRGVDLPGDVIALCAECHKTFHDNREVAG